MSAPRYRIGRQQIALAQASGAFQRRREGNPPLYLPRWLYEGLKAEGADMRDLAVREPLP